MNEDDERTFTVTFPEDYAEEALQGKEVEFTAKMLELRERSCREVDDDFAGLVGPYDDMAALRADLEERMKVNALDRARHEFVDRIIEYATANATVVLPELLVEREVGVMIDELKVRVAEQGIAYEDYLRVTEKDEAALREEYREGAEKRVKVLLVLGAIADKEEVTVSDEDVQAEIDRVNGRPRGRRLHQEVPRLRPRPQLHPLAAAPLARWWSCWPTAGSRPTPSSRACKHQHGHTHDDGRRGDAARPRDRGRRGGHRGGGSSRRRGPRHDPTPEHPDRFAGGRSRPADHGHARAHGHRVLEPRRARLRHLQPAAQGPHHLPR